MENSKRRDFIKKSVLGVTGVTLLQGKVIASEHTENQDYKTTDLPSRMLGRTGIKTPLISLGAAVSVQS